MENREGRRMKEVNKKGTGGRSKVRRSVEQKCTGRLDGKKFQVWSRGRLFRASRFACQSCEPTHAGAAAPYLSFAFSFSIDCHFSLPLSYRFPRIAFYLAPLVARLYHLSSPRSRFHSRMTRCCWCSGTRSLARRRLAPFIMIIIVLRDSHHGQTINRPNDDHHNNNDIRIALTFTILLVLSIRNDMINIGVSTKTKLTEFKYSHRYFYVIVDDRKRN